jgi:hypothetical protein
MTTNSRRYGEHVREQTQQNQRWRRDRVVRQAIEHGNKAMAVDDDAEAARVLAYVILRGLRSRDTRTLADYHELLSDDPELPWHWHELKSFEDSPETFIAPLEDGARGSFEASQAAETVRRAFEAAESIAAHHGIVEDQLRNYATATGYSLQTGILHKTYEFEHDSEISLVSRRSGLTKTLYNGKTGEGKSTSLDGEVEDRFNSGFKVIDVLDTDELESGVYDIPQQQDVLRDVREEMGLPADFTESDEHDRPNIEILVPLTPGLDGEELPFDTESEQFTARPFTIPASKLSKRSLLGFLKSVVTKQQEVAIGLAYEEVRDEKDDWTLKDLAQKVRRQKGLADNFKHRVTRLLKSLQDKGFIRTQSCPHALDWERIFRDIDTITVFSTSLMREREDKLMVISYLFRALYHERVGLGELPDCVGVGRELHEIVGHQNTRSDDEREKAIQEGIKTELGYILRKNRHESLELIMDTQDILDLDKSIRKRFNRAITFRTQDESLEELFKQVAGNKGAYYNYGDVVSKHWERGVGTVLGNTGPNAVGNTPFLSPVKFAPPSWHNFDNDEDDTGWESRVKYIEREELRAHSWDTSLPDELAIGISEDEEPEEGGEGDVDEREQAMNTFAEECILDEPDGAVPAEDVREAFKQFAKENDWPVIDSPQSFGMWFSRAVDYNNDRFGGVQHYETITLTPVGESYAFEDSGTEAAAGLSD